MKDNDFMGRRSLFAYVDPFEIEQASVALERSEKMFKQFTSKFKTEPQHKQIYITAAGASTTSPFYRQFKEMSQQMERSDQNE